MAELFIGESKHTLVYSYSLVWWKQFWHVNVEHIPTVIYPLENCIKCRSRRWHPEPKSVTKLWAKKDNHADVASHTVLNVKFCFNSICMLCREKSAHDIPKELQTFLVQDHSVAHVMYACDHRRHGLHEGSACGILQQQLHAFQLRKISKLILWEWHALCNFYDWNVTWVAWSKGCRCRAAFGLPKPSPAIRSCLSSTVISLVLIFLLQWKLNSHILRSL